MLAADSPSEVTSNPNDAPSATELAGLTGGEWRQTGPLSYEYATVEIDYDPRATPTVIERKRGKVQLDPSGGRITAVTDVLETTFDGQVTFSVTGVAYQGVRVGFDFVGL